MSQIRILFLFFFNSQVSHDFAVNFDEDNPECAGMIEHSFIPILSIYPI